MDAETLLYPSPQPLEGIQETEPGPTAGDRLLTGTVLRTGLLPGWRSGGDRLPPRDISGLGGVASHPAVARACTGPGINTDGMDGRPARGSVEAGRNVRRDGRPRALAARLRGELTGGFESMYRLLMESRDALCRADGPLSEMRGHAVRFIYRPTRIYGALAAAAWRPDVLRSGAEYGIHLEQLARAFLGAGDRPAVWPVLAAEVRAMEPSTCRSFRLRPTRPTSSSTTAPRSGTTFTRPSYETMLELGRVDVRGRPRASAARDPSVAPGEGRTRPGREAGDLSNRHAGVGGPSRPTSCSLPPLRSGSRDRGSRALSDGARAVSWIGLSQMEGSDRYQLDVLARRCTTEAAEWPSSWRLSAVARASRASLRCLCEVSIGCVAAFETRMRAPGASSPG